jgi:hypothetical protein
MAYRTRVVISPNKHSKHALAGRQGVLWGPRSEWSRSFWTRRGWQLECGKSTLMKYVTEARLTEKHLLEWAKGQTLHCPSYYFSKLGISELQKSLRGLYRTLLATLIQHEKGLFRVAFPNWQIFDSNHEPTAAILRDALERILTKPDVTCKYCFFIDGLDEYQETDSLTMGRGASLRMTSSDLHKCQPSSLWFPAAQSLYSS